MRYIPDPGALASAIKLRQEHTNQMMGLLLDIVAKGDDPEDYASPSGFEEPWARGVAEIKRQLASA